MLTLPGFSPSSCIVPLTLPIKPHSGQSLALIIFSSSQRPSFLRIDIGVAFTCFRRRSTNRSAYVQLGGRMPSTADYHNLTPSSWRFGPFNHDFSDFLGENVTRACFLRTSFRTGSHSLVCLPLMRYSLPVERRPHCVFS
jgi:hypothetical protein